jgi:hypothetical protein
MGMRADLRLGERDAPMALQWVGRGVNDCLRCSRASLVHHWSRHHEGFLEHASNLLHK